MRHNQKKNTREREKKIRPDKKKKIRPERNNNAEFAKAARLVSDMGEREAEEEDQFWRVAEDLKSRAAKKREERAEFAKAARIVSDMGECEAEEEDQFWSEAEGLKSRAAKKREERADFSKAARIVSDMGEREAEEEDQFWREAEGPKSRAAKKRKERAEKRAEAAAKKAEARKLLEEEEAIAMRLVRKKVTEAEWLRIKEEVAMRREEELEKKRSRALGAVEYMRNVDAENVNRAPVYVDPRSVVAAINLMGVDPKKRRSRNDVLFENFVRDKLPILEAEAPSLSRNQYLALLWKRWNRVAKLAAYPKKWNIIV